MRLLLSASCTTDSILNILGSEIMVQLQLPVLWGVLDMLCLVLFWILFTKRFRTYIFFFSLWWSKWPACLLAVTSPPLQGFLCCSSLIIRNRCFATVRVFFLLLGNSVEGIWLSGKVNAHKNEIFSTIAAFWFGYCRRRFIVLVTKKVESSD